MVIIALAIISCGSESNSGDSDYFEEESPVPVRLDTFLDTDNDGLVNAYDSDYLNAEVKINGNGTLDNPYRIRTIYQLQAIAGVDHNGNILNQSQFTNRSWLFGDSKEEQLRSVYTLPVINLDASFTREWNNGSGFHPIGRCENTLSCADSTQVFTGRFIGAGHRITNLYISRQREDQIGLFGTIGTEGQVSLLSLDNVYILGGNIVGGMAARNYGNITASSTEGNFISGNFSGGLVGINYGRISAASFEGEINSGSYIGGIVGENLGQIEYSYAEGIIIGKTLVGGLVGSNSGTVYDSHTYIGVGLGPGGLGGGLIGLGEGIIFSNLGSEEAIISEYTEDSLTNIYITSLGLGYHTATIQVYDIVSVDEIGDSSIEEGINGTSIGGLVGRNSKGGEVGSSYSAGAVIGKYEVGGLIGTNEEEAEILSSGSIATTHASYAVGGLAGVNRGKVFNSYSNNNVTGQLVIGGLIGNSTGTIEGSYSLGTVIGKDIVGGLAGYAESNVNQSFAQVMIKAEDRLGGLIGKYGSVKGLRFSYAVTNITIKDGGKFGGLVAEHPPGFSTNSYWDAKEINGLPSIVSSSGVELSLAQFHLCRSEGINLNETLCRDIFSGWDKELVQNNTSVFWDFSDRESPPVLVSRSLDNKADIRINQCLITAKESCRTNILLSQASEGVKLIRLVTPPGDSVVNYEPAFKIEDTELFRVDGENLVLARNAIAKDIGVHKFRVQVMLAAGDGKVYDYSQEIVAQFIDK